MTSAYIDPPAPVEAPAGVYQPQHDTRLLIDVLLGADLARGKRVADLCTGSGAVAIAAATEGAAEVLAFDGSARAARCADANARTARADVRVFNGSWTLAAHFGPFDVVTCNPPYVPEPCDGELEDIPVSAGPPMAYNAGSDGRLVLDPLCAAAPGLLDEGGTLLVVQSEFSGTDASLTALSDAGLSASVVARQWVPFGPVLTARAGWMERVGLLEAGRRVEELVVIRADAS